MILSKASHLTVKHYLPSLFTVCYLPTNNESLTETLTLLLSSYIYGKLLINFCRECF